MAGKHEFQLELVTTAPGERPTSLEWKVAFVFHLLECPSHSSASCLSTIDALVDALATNFLPHKACHLKK